MRIHYKASDISENLANHDNGKHFKRSAKHWAKAGIEIKDINDFAKHIEKVLNDKETEVLKVSDTKDIYYNKKYKTTAIVNHSEKDKGTCYFSPNRNSFRKNVNEARKNQYKLGLHKSSLMKGGIDKLFVSKEIKKKEKSFSNNFKDTSKYKQHKAKKYVTKKIKRVEKDPTLNAQKRKEKQQNAARIKEQEKERKLREEKLKMYKDNFKKMQERKDKFKLEQQKRVEEQKREQQKQQSKNIEKKLRAEEIAKREEAERRRIAEQRRKELEERERRKSLEDYRLNRDGISKRF